MTGTGRKSRASGRIRINNGRAKIGRSGPMSGRRIGSKRMKRTNRSGPRMGKSDGTSPSNPRRPIKPYIPSVSPEKNHKSIWK
jgi:hypothetical protein